MVLLMPLVITPPTSTSQPSWVQLIPLILILPLIAFWLWMFRDMLNNDSLPSDAKNGWTLAFVFLNVFAAVVYYAMIYRNRD